MKNKMYDLFKGLVVMFALAMVSGCGLFWDDPYIQVSDAPLNWCEIHYYNATKEPIRRDTIRISGTGLVEVRSGTSQRVTDSFSKSTDGARNGFHTQQYYADREVIRSDFQNLVNAGLFDKDKMFTSTKTPSPGRFIAVRAAFDNRTFSENYNMFEKDPELAERLFNMVHEYRRVTLGRRRNFAGRRNKEEDSAKDDSEKDDSKKGDSATDGKSDGESDKTDKTKKESK